MSGLVAGLERKNGWTLAERAGEVSPDGMQRLLRRADWDVDGVRDDVRDYVISGGENIYPAEVKSALNSLPGITESAVIAVPDARWGEVGAAFIVGSGGHDWNPDTIRQALAPKLASYKIPKYVQHVPNLPKTATGKVRKRDLSQLIKETADDHHC